MKFEGVSLQVINSSWKAIFKGVGILKLSVALNG